MKMHNFTVYKVTVIHSQKLCWVFIWAYVTTAPTNQ